MVERLVIHAGAPKTATTYIQHGLFTNLELLKQAGVYLPQSGRLEIEPHGFTHHHLAWDLLDPGRFRGATGSWGALAAELADVDAPVAILSSEAFSRVACRREGPANVISAAKEIVSDVRIVYFVRNQLSLLNSLYGQRVKSLRAIDAFAPHASSHLGSVLNDFPRLLSAWYQSDDIDFVAVPFTGSRDVDPLAELLRVSGVEVDSSLLVAKRDDVNRSLGPVGIEAARLLGAMLRGLYPDFDPEEPAAKRLYRRSSLRASKYGWCDEPFWGWTPETAAAAAERFAARNEEFAQAVWGHGWDLPMPVDTETSAVALLELPPPTIERVHSYVTTMARRFDTLRNDKEQASDGPAEAGPEALFPEES